MLTGGGGFVGSHAVEALVRAGHSLRLLARSREKLERVLAPLGLPLPEIAVGDMTDASAVRRALEGCDAVIHAAATFYGGEDVYEANLAGVRHVLGIASELRLDPIVYVSTVAAMFPPPGPVITTDDPIANLRTTYGRSKAEGERFARDLQARGVPVVTVYPAGVYGPRDPVPGETTKGLVDRVRLVWPITSGGTGCVDVRDVARILVAVLEPGRGPRRFMAGGHFLTWAQEADLCERILGRRVRRVRLPGAGVRAVAALLDWLKRWVDFDYALTAEAAEFVTRFVPCDSRVTVEQLGIEFRPTEETLGDAIRWLYESGRLTAKQVPRLAASSAPELGVGGA
jgi:nucleoside-diphosphate-sugar epimerase